MMQKLLYHPFPAEHEGLHGFLLRLVEGNQLQGVKQLWGGRHPSQEDLRARLGLTPSSNGLDRLFRQWEWRGGNRPLWNGQTSRYCPACLKEGSYWRQEWELSMMAVCPTHSCALTDVCHACGKMLDWRRASLHICPCGQQLCEAPAIPADKKEARLASVFADKVRGTECAPGHLQLLSLDQFHRLAVTLGAYATVTPRKSELQIRQFRTLSTVRPLFSAAAKTLIGWPKGFHRLLKRLEGSRGTSEAAKIPARFGRIYDYLFKNFQEPAFGFVLHAFEAYVEKTWRYSLTERNKRFSAELRRTHLWVPAKAAAAQLGVSRRQIGLLVEAGKIDGSIKQTPAGRTVLCVDRRQIPVMQETLNDLIDLKTAAAMLGLKKSRAAQLVEHHLLGPAIAPKSARASRWALSKSTLEQILFLGSDLPVGEERGDASLVGLPYALQYWLHKDYLFPRLILGVIKGEIIPVAQAKERVGLGAWVFERQILKQWIADQVKEKRKGAVTLPEAAKYLRIKQEVAYHLVKGGLLDSWIEKDSKCLLIKQSALDEFSQAYSLCTDLASRVGYSSKHLVLEIEKRGVMPVSGPCVDGCRQYIYRQGHDLNQVIEDILVRRDAI